MTKFYNKRLDNLERKRLTLIEIGKILLTHPTTVMKIWTLFGVAALGLAGTGFGQYATDPVGFVTLNLQTGNNFVGFSLMPSKVHQGAITVSPTDRTRIFLTNTVVTNDQFNPAAITVNTPSTHVIEVVTQGSVQGINVAIVDTIATGSEIVLQEALHPGVANASEIRIWKLWTIGDAFGATNSAGLTAGTSSTADLILIPSGAGYDQYFYSTGGAPGVGWRRVGGGNTSRAHVPLYYTDAFLIFVRGAPKALTVAGSVKPDQTTVVLETGNNFLCNLCPVNAGGANPSSAGRTLGNSNLYNGTAQGLTGGPSGLADLVLFWNGTGYNQYYYSLGGAPGIGWRQVGGGNSSRATVALPDGAFMVLRRGAATTVALSQTSF